MSPNHIEFFWTSFLTFIFSLFFIIFNYWISEDEQIKKAIRINGSELERMLLQCDEDDDGSIMINLKDGKVYIGWIDKLNPPTRNDYIKILLF